MKLTARIKQRLHYVNLLHGEIVRLEGFRFITSPQNIAAPISNMEMLHRLTVANSEYGKFK